jgi:hypothetical protein
MNTLVPQPAFLALLAACALVAHAAPSRATSLSVSGDYVHWSGHHDPDDARLAITTEDGKVTLLLTDRLIALQLSDRMVHRVRRELRDKQDEERDNVLALAIASAVIGTVQELIDDSFSCCLHDVRDVSYEDGRLRLIGRNGKPLFEDADMCDTDVLASFSERDALRFVREFRRIKGRG